MKYVTSVGLLLAILIAGCQSAQPVAKPVRQAQGRPANDGSISTPAGMMEYLRKQNLPALQTVELWQNQYGPGLKLCTQHYEVLTTLMEPLMLSQVPGFLESAYRGYNEQLGTSVESGSRFTVYLFAERQQWEDFTKSFAPYQAELFGKIKAGAYYLNGVCVVYNIGRERTFSTLGHEGWHQFNSRHFKYRLPSWLDEGVATMFETSRYEQGMFYFEPGKNLYRLGALKKTLMEQNQIPLAKLVGMNPGEAVVASDEEVTAFYGQVYGLVRFLREDNYGKRLQQYQNMLLGGLRGDWPLDELGRKIAGDRNITLTAKWNRTIGPKLFEFYIGSDLDSIEKQYLQFCRKIVYYVQIQ